MATLKDHQQAMVDLLASGSGIPASASRLAHATFDILETLMLANLTPSQQQALIENRRPDATTPGLNDKALAADVEACQVKLTGAGAKPKADLFDRAIAAERRVKELENTVNQLRAGNQKLRHELGKWRSVESQLVRATVAENQTEEFNWLSNARDIALGYITAPEPEQAGCRKDDTQESGLSATKGFLVPPGARFVCVQGKTCMNCGAVTTRNVSTCDDCGEPL